MQPGAAERAGGGRVQDTYSTVTLPASSLTPGWGLIDVFRLPWDRGAGEPRSGPWR